MLHRNVQALCESMKYNLTSLTGTTGITSGCFDIIHPLHVQYLERCASKCDNLIVLIDSGDMLSVNKKRQEVFSAYDRAFMVDSIKGVYAVAIMNKLEEFTECLRSLKALSHKLVVFKNASKVYDTPLIKVRGVENIIIPDLNVFDSTTSIRNHILKQH